MFRGEFEDSMGRVVGALATTNADVIVKVNGSYPLVDPWCMDELLDALAKSEAEYGYNEHHQGLLTGLGVEVMRRELIERADREIKSPAQRLMGSKIFLDLLPPEHILRLDYPELARPEYRVTMAVPEDVYTLEQIVQNAPSLDFKGIVAFFDTNPLAVRYSLQVISGPKEVGLEKVMLFPDKTGIFSKSKPELDLSYPISVELSLTNRCNLACKWCSDMDLRHRAMEDMPLEVLDRLIEDLAKGGTKGLVIEGGGEPTLYKEFEAVVDKATREGLALGLISNGVRLPDLQRFKNFEWVRVSLDAATREQFFYSKGRDRFDQVLNNLKALVTLKRDANVVVGVGYVLTRENEENLEELVLGLRRIGVDYVQIRPVIDHPELSPLNMNLEYLAKHAAANFSVNVHNLKENVIKGNANLPCRTHSLSTVIAANGDVFLCGRLNKYDWFKPIGNIKEKSFKDIWNGEERARQAAMVFDREFCTRFCPECRLTKFNVLFNNMSQIKTRNFI